MSDRLRCAVELRESDDGPMLDGVILQEGRAAQGGRAELFAPGAVVWPSDGIGILTRHLGPVETRAVPVRAGNGEIRISVKATPALVDAIKAGKDGMSVEFVSQREHRTAGGVREIQRAMVDAATLTSNPEYPTRAELRERRAAVWL